MFYTQLFEPRSQSSLPFFSPFFLSPFSPFFFSISLVMPLILSLFLCCCCFVGGRGEEGACGMPWLSSLLSVLPAFFRSFLLSFVLSVFISSYWTLLVPYLPFFLKVLVSGDRGRSFVMFIFIVITLSRAALVCDPVLCKVSLFQHAFLGRLALSASTRAATVRTGRCAVRRRTRACALPAGRGSSATSPAMR